MSTKRSEVIGTEELALKFQALDEAFQGAHLVSALQAGSLVLRNAIVENIKDQGLIKARNLSRSVHSEVVEQSPKRAEVDTGTDSEYGPIHEFGGVIRAKQGKYLAIPVGTYTGSPRSHSDLHPRKASSGSLVLVDANGTVQYVLKESVIMPARPYMRPAYDENQQEIQGETAEAFKVLIMKAVA